MLGDVGITIWNDYDSKSSREKVEFTKSGLKEFKKTSGYSFLD